MNMAIEQFPLLEGRATKVGTDAFRQRMHQNHVDSYTDCDAFWVSSLGIGTYLGDITSDVDELYGEALVFALRSGINLIDTAHSYRDGRSERVIGRVLRRAVEAKELHRSEIVISTKAGFLSLSGASLGAKLRVIREKYIDSGLLTWDDLAGGHAMSPRYLEYCIHESRNRLGLACLDVFYLHNPESQLRTIDRNRFERRTRAAFEALEQAASAGHIAAYGIATWDGLTAAGKDALSLERMVGLARDVAGDGHHLKWIQLPYNLNRTDALDRPTQQVGKTECSAFDAAGALGLRVMTSASINRNASWTFFESGIPGLESLPTPIQRSLQIVRSTPGVTSALVGMKMVSHVWENALVLTGPKAPAEAIFGESDA